MLTDKRLLGKEKFDVKLEPDFFIELSFFVIFLVILTVMDHKDIVLFHSSTEIFSSTISFGVFVITLNTFKINKNKFLLFLGIGYFFVGIIDLLQSFSYPGVSILFEHGNMNVSEQLWISARYLGALTWLGSAIIAYRNKENFKMHFTFIIYLSITSILMLSIFYFKLFPNCFNNSIGFTNFRIVSEYIIIAVFLLSFILYFNLRNNMDWKLFWYMECFLVATIISVLFLSKFSRPHDWMYITAHLLKVIAHYFLYKSIIETSLKRPYAVLYYSLDKAGNELETARNNLRENAKRREQIEEVITTNEQCYELVINNSSDGIFIQKDGVIIFANDVAAKLLGVQKIDELIDKAVLDFVPENEKENALKRRKEAYLNKSSIPFLESKLLRPDGEELDIEVAVNYILYQGDGAVLVMFRDITSRKRISKLTDDIRENQKKLQETMEFNRMTTEFFSNISHELKTPLNVILGAMQILMLHSVTDEQGLLENKHSKYLKVMKQNCYRLLRLVNNLIDLSKVDSGYLKPNLSNCNIVSVVEDITLSVADHVENKGVELIFDTDTEEKLMAVDTDKIERIMLNLLSNALKFTDTGNQILVNVIDKGEKVLISVKDNGIGIPEDKLQLIFERFGQVDKSLTRNREGSGIGLSLVKSLVEMHNGKVCVVSKPGEGSEFIIELPVMIAEKKDSVEIGQALFQSKVERISIEFSDVYGA